MILFAAAAILALLLVVYVFAGGGAGGGNPDRLTERKAPATRKPAPAQGCDAAETNGAIKRELFRQATQLRGTDQAAFDQIAANSTLRVGSAEALSSDEDTGSFSCSGNMTLELPPGVSVVGGRRALTSEIDFKIQRSADGAGNILTLSNADGIITPLAALVQNGAEPAEPELQPAEIETVDEPEAVTERAPPPRPEPPARQAEAPSPPRKAPAVAAPKRATVAKAPTRPVPAPTQPRAPAATLPQASAGPSFNCRYARTQSEIAVCRNADLAGLDRQMGAQFNSGMSRGTAAQRALLQRTRSRFLSHRNSCRTNACITDAYNGRMREISDILADRWKPY